MISTQVLRFPQPPIEPPPIIANFAAPAAPAALPASPAAPEVAPSKRRRETGAAPVLAAPKRARCESESSFVCEVAVFAAAGRVADACWPRIVAGGFNDARKLLRLGDNDLAALGVPPDAIARLRCGLRRFQ